MDSKSGSRFARRGGRRIGFNYHARGHRYRGPGHSGYGRGGSMMPTRTQIQLSFSSGGTPQSRTLDQGWFGRMLHKRRTEQQKPNPAQMERIKKHETAQAVKKERHAKFQKNREEIRGQNKQMIKAQQRIREIQTSLTHEE